MTVLGSHVSCGNHHAPSAALKISVRWDLVTGTLQGPSLDHACTSDHRLLLHETPIPAGAVWLADLGFFDLTVLRAISAADGLWLTRIHATTAVLSPTGERLDGVTLLRSESSDTLDMPVRVGATDHLSARLLAVRVAQEVTDQRRRRIRAEAKRRGRAPTAAALTLAAWTILMTNIPLARLTVAEALVLVRVRWQVELLFKLWKSHEHIDQWRSAKAPAILCEVYAKLLGALIQHWVLLQSCWQYPDRSLTKAAQTIRQHIICLVLSLYTPHLVDAVRYITRCIAAGCRINKRKSNPHTYYSTFQIN